jgi:hypothetical protein
MQLDQFKQEQKAERYKILRQLPRAPPPPTPPPLPTPRSTCLYKPDPALLALRRVNVP